MPKKSVKKPKSRFKKAKLHIAPKKIAKRAIKKLEKKVAGNLKKFIVHHNFAVKPDLQQKELKSLIDNASRAEKFEFKQFKGVKKHAPGIVVKNEDSKTVEKPVPEMSRIAAKIRKEQIIEQRRPLVETLGNENLKGKIKGDTQFVYTGIEGLDELLMQGIPKGNSILVAGGAGSGKTILCLQTLFHHAKMGKKCLYMSFEESEKNLIQHMESFGWSAKELVKKNKLRIVRMNPFDVTRNVDALLAKQKGELLIEVDPLICPPDFAHPDFIVIDSLTAIASAFSSGSESYRIYIEQLFRFLEKSGATSFLVAETQEVPEIYSSSGVEEFLADGVIVLYNLKHENVRENALEVLKLRGAAHKKNLVAMQITSEGIVVYPEQEVLAEID